MNQQPRFRMTLVAACCQAYCEQLRYQAWLRNWRG
jgi:hypothetical protein